VFGGEKGSVNKNARFQRLAGADFTVVSSTGVRSGTSAGRPGGVWGYRELLRLLVRRDLQARYRDSFLGFLWTLLRPLVLFGMYFVVLGQVLGAARGIPDFAVYLFSGLTIFGLFSDTVVSATSSILANAGLVKKVYIPRQLSQLSPCSPSQSTLDCCGSSRAWPSFSSTRQLSEYCCRLSMCI
jgi:ABC-2 type transporter